MGLLFGLAGGRQRDPPSSRAFRWGLGYLNLGIVAASGALYSLNPDWMWMYWVDARALPVAVVVLAFAMYEAAFVAGFVLVPLLERARRGAGVAAAVATGAAITAAEVAARVRLFHFGTLAEFRAGRAPAGIHDGTVEPEMWVVLTTGAVSAAALVLAVRAVARGHAR